MWCSWARGQVNYDKGPRGLVSADPDGKAFSNWKPKPPSQMFSRVRRECGMKTGPAQVMLLNGGGKRKKEGKGRMGRAARGPQRKVLMSVTKT